MERGNMGLRFIYLNVSLRFEAFGKMSRCIVLKVPTCAKLTFLRQSYDAEIPEPVECDEVDERKARCFARVRNLWVRGDVVKLSRQRYV
jgi:hypothetical protein